ncbi:MAG: DUF4277 domain-containing protein [Methanoregula sp.]|nr:DUF4277 domain-containing protein [Methanoregula sp.]
MMLIDGSDVNIGHPGIVDGMFDTLEIGQYIDEVIPKSRCHHPITRGTAVKALSLNGLGYNEGRLSLMPDFFEDRATERLLGKGIKPEYLHEYVFGERLDAIAAYGPTRLFTLIVLRKMERLPLGVQRLHPDTTSISFTGEYDHEFKTRISSPFRNVTRTSMSLSGRSSPRTNEPKTPIFAAPNRF